MSDLPATAPAIRAEPSALDAAVERLQWIADAGAIAAGMTKQWRLVGDIRTVLDALKRGQQALAALQKATKSNNTENPWLGVCAPVALLQMDREKAEAAQPAYRPVSDAELLGCVRGRPLAPTLYVREDEAARYAAWLNSDDEPLTEMDPAALDGHV